MTSPSPKRTGLVVAAAIAACVLMGAAQADTVKMKPTLIADITAIVAAQPGSRIGVCVAMPDRAPACVNGDQRFSLQSVVKVLLAAAILDAVENKQLTLEQNITLTQQDVSVYMHPLAELIARDGTYTTTIRDLVARAVNDSDNAACDKLIALLGGPQAVQGFLAQKGLTGIRVDRDEKNLQSDIAGLHWKDEYNDPARFNAARQSVTEDKKQAAYDAYKTDIRDTATPKEMTAFLQQVADGALLHSDSTKTLVDIMKQTRTGADRLRAGLREGWQLANKTGTSSSHNGVSVATNDVGILIAPDGTRIPVAVFVADSTATADERASVMARITESVINHYSR